MIGVLIIPTKAVTEGKTAFAGKPNAMYLPIAAISLEFRQGWGGKARHLRGTGLQEEATPYATMRSIPSSEFSFSAPMGPCVRHA
ncbi:hypothetical protein TNIN_204601 [Trichonephila inaurata madagascariensis]|uniref:Uncharacterized protein n=1 Tax=Trichonephila inaurata madagascariensis TaxID=2747483 RepID=A0A8X6Y0J3_9ARAC|nr:hypothetical protein TNIN_204601 [Trichonephila inaurata madagascariensis]